MEFCIQRTSWKFVLEHIIWVSGLCFLPPDVSRAQSAYVGYCKSVLRYTYFVAESCHLSACSVSRKPLTDKLDGLENLYTPDLGTKPVSRFAC